jgi:ribosome recycling factor
MNVIEQAKKKMNSVLEHLKNELKSIRTGRANPGMLDPVRIEAYGTQMKLRDMATVSVPEPRMIVISPFDPQNLHAIAKGIEKANIGLQPVVEANLIRLKIPDMSQSVRQDMVKLARKKCEETKVSIRNIRREYNDMARGLENEGDITEDERKGLEKDIQNQTDHFCKLSDTLAQEKEREILTI